MKSMKKIVVASLAMIALAGCQEKDENLEITKKGEPVSIRFNVSVPKMDDITVATKASDVVETNVEKMAILFYDADDANSKPIVVKVDNMGTPTQKSATNYTYTIELDESQLTDGDRKVTSGKWYMYPVANYDKGYATVSLDDLKALTKSELFSYAVAASGRDITESSVLMTGKYDSDDSSITLVAGDENTFENVFHLKRIVSKTIFNFVNGTGVTFTPQKYSIYNYSGSSTLFERDEVTSYAGKNVFTKAENLPVSGSGFFFYMPENAQVATTAPTSWTYADRDRRNADDYSTFTYAPANATYVVVEGTYSGPGENGEGTVTGTVKYTIHLGNFGSSATGGTYNNFIVKRNSKYTYKITVNGVKNIIAEAKQESDNQPGAEGQIVKPTPHVVVNLDSHYENVLLTLSKNAVANYSLSVKTPYDNFVDNNGESKNTEAVKWVKFGKPASTTTFSNYPGDTKVVDIYGLVDALKTVDTSSDYYLVSGNNVYVQAYVDEYFYSDKETGTFVNADDRSLSFTLGTAQISTDKHSSYIEGEGFTLKQKSIRTFYNTSVSNPFGIEYVEETPEATLGSTDTFAGEELQNGLKDTKENIGDNASWDTYVDISANGFSGATAPVAANIMTTTGNNPMYQCLSRNRDLDGNGNISDDEIRWYLPSFRQYLYIWFGKKVLPTDISFNRTNYVSSTNEGYRVWWALEGTGICSWDSFLTDMGADSKVGVRCVRNLGTSTDGDVSPVSSWNQTQKTVTITGLKDEALRSSTQVGEYPEHENSAAASTLPKAFKVASANLVIPGDANAPVITVGTLNPTGITESSNMTTNHKITVPVTITNYDASKSYSYKVGNGSETAVSASTFNISIDIDWTNQDSGSTSTEVRVKTSSGGSSSFNVTITRTTRQGRWTTYYTYAYSDSTPSDGTADKTGFAYTEIMTGSLCEKNYYEESDKSDLGKWRIPNEKELYFIQLYCSGEFDLGTGSKEPDKDYVGARTKYPRNSTDVPYMIYYLMKDGESKTPIISTGHGQAGLSFKVRCVRDTEASTDSDSSLSSGGEGLGF